MRCRDARLALCGSRAGGKAPVQATPSLAIKWGLLARGASAGSGAAALEGALGAKSPWNALFEVSFCHAKISTGYGVLLYPILGDVARHAWLGPRTADQAKLSCATCAQVTLKAETWVGALLSVDRGS